MRNRGQSEVAKITHRHSLSCPHSDTEVHLRHHLPPQPFEWFQSLVTCMGKDAYVRIASKAGQPIAGIVTLDHGKKMVHKYDGSDTQFNSLGGTPMLFWRAIKEAK